MSARIETFNIVLEAGPTLTTTKYGVEKSYQAANIELTFRKGGTATTRKTSAEFFENGQYTRTNLNFGYPVSYTILTPTRTERSGGQASFAKLNKTFIVEITTDRNEVFTILNYKIHHNRLITTLNKNKIKFIPTVKHVECDHQGCNHAQGAVCTCTKCGGFSHGFGFEELYGISLANVRDNLSSLTKAQLSELRKIVLAA